MLGPRSHEDKQYEIIFIVILHAVVLSRSRDDRIPDSALAFFTGDVQRPLTLGYIVDFVRLGVAVNSLLLPGPQAVQIAEVPLGPEERHLLHLVRREPDQGVGILERIIAAGVRGNHGAYCSG